MRERWRSFKTKKCLKSWTRCIEQVLVNDDIKGFNLDLTYLFILGEGILNTKLIKVINAYKYHLDYDFITFTSSIENY